MKFGNKNRGSTKDIPRIFMDSFRDLFEKMGSKDGMGRALKTIADQ